MRTVRAGLLAAVLVTTSGCFGWAQHGGDARATSYNPYERVLTSATVPGLRPLWSSDAVVSPAAIRTWGGRVVMADAAAMTGLDLRTGAVVWQHPARDSYPLIRNGTVYAQESGCDGALRAYAYDTGERRPDEDVLPWGGSAACISPAGEGAIGGRYAYVPVIETDGQSGRYYGYLYDWRTGTGRAASLGSQIATLDESAGVAVTVHDPAGAAYRYIRAEPFQPSGPRWVRETAMGFPTRAAIEDGAVYVGVHGGTGEPDGLMVLDLATGQDEWTGIAPIDPETAPGNLQKPALRHGTAFLTRTGGNIPGEILAFEACGEPSCGPVWTSRGGQAPGGWTEPTVAGDVVYVVVSSWAGSTSTLLAYAAEGCGAPTCDPIVSVSVGGSVASQVTPPVVADGRVLVTTTTGVHAFGL